MTNSAPTKAQLSEQLEALATQVSELTEKLEQAERVQLRQTLWLQGDEPRRSGRTQGGDAWVAFSGQYAARKEGEARRYGAYKDFVAYGEVAEAVTAAYAEGNKLVALEAYERPAQPKEGETRRFSDWVLTQFAPVPRMEPQGSPEPSEDEIPF